MLPAVGEDEGTILPWPVALPQNADKRRFPRASLEGGCHRQWHLRRHRTQTPASAFHPRRHSRRGPGLA